jgi:hypothetical protein
VARIVFVSERLHLTTTTPVAGLLLQAANNKVFKVLYDDKGSYQFVTLDSRHGFSGPATSRPGMARPFNPARNYGSENDGIRLSRETFQIPDKIDVFTDRRFAKLMTGPVLQARQGSDLTRLAVILTDMAAQGIYAAQLIDRKGVSHTLVDLDQLTTIKKARARLHESFGWPRCTAIRELPAPQVVHRFIIIDRKIVADTPLLTTAAGLMSEVTYRREDGITSKTVRSVPARDIPQTVISWLNEVIEALHPRQKSALIDVALSPDGPSLADIHDVFDQEWFAADHSAIITKLSELQKSQFDDTGAKKKPRLPGVLEVLRDLDVVHVEENP